MNIHIVLVTYAVDVTPLIEALDAPDITWHIFSHSTRPEARPNKMPGNFSFHDYGVNRGLARSWNDGLIEAYSQGADCAILLNDDVQMNQTDLYQLAMSCVAHPECGLVTARGWNVRMDERQDLGFAIIGTNPLALERIGYFDENYTPLYGEDVDYSRRAALAGLSFGSAGDTGIVHTGSATQTVPELSVQNQVTFQANQAYHRRKWGAAYGHETYSIPFNDSHFNLRIDENVRHAPYEGFNRTDIEELVKL